VVMLCADDELGCAVTERCLLRVARMCWWKGERVWCGGKNVDACLWKRERGSRDERSRFSGRRALRPRKVVVGCRSPHSSQDQTLCIHTVYIVDCGDYSVKVPGPYIFNGVAGANPSNVIISCADFAFNASVYLSDVGFVHMSKYASVPMIGHLRCRGHS
jgi:hypothetical protein